MRHSLQKVFVVFKMHYDIGFTHLVAELLDLYSHDLIERVLRVCEATADRPPGQRYVWTMPSWPLQKTLDGITDPVVKQKVEKFVADGQIISLSLPFTTHTEFCGLEEFIRGLYIARRLALQNGRWPADAKMTDVPGHTWMLPSLLAKAGVKFLHLGSNSAVMPANVPRLFLWEGPDGGRVLTFYSAGAYGTELNPPADWDYPYWLAMLQTGDNLGPQGADYLAELFARAARDLPGTEVVIGSLEDFGRAILAGDFDIPVIRGDLADTWIRGVGSAPGGVARVRAIRAGLVGLESALCFKKMVGLYGNEALLADERALLSRGFENSLLFGEHTWGLDCKITLLNERSYGAPWDGREFRREQFEFLKENDPGYRRIARSWQEQLDFLTVADQSRDDLRRNILPALAAAVDWPGERLAVANHLGWTRTARIVLDGALDTATGLVDPESQAVYPVRRNFEGRPVARLDGLPALGYKTFGVLRDDRGVSQESDRGPVNAPLAYLKDSFGVLDNQFFRLEIDPLSGEFRSFYEKTARKEWVNRNAAFGFGQYVYDIYSHQEMQKYLFDYCYAVSDWYVNDVGKPGYPVAQRHHRFIQRNFQISAKNGPDWGALQISKRIDDASATQYGNARELRVIVTVYRDDAYLDLQYELLGKNETPLIESGHFALPFSLDNPQYRVNKLGCVIDPVRDIAPGCNKDLFCCERWLDISDGHHGMAVIPIDMPLFSFDDPGVMQYRPDKEPQEPTVLLHAFNNAYGTNFPQWIGGNLFFRYRLLPHAGHWNDGEVWKIAHETMNPPLWGSSRNAARGLKIPARQEIFAKELEGFVVLAFKPAEEGEGYILRLHEQSGVARRAVIHLNLKLATAHGCDLIERKTENLAVISEKGISRFQFETEPFEVHTFYLGICGFNESSR